MSKLAVELDGETFQIEINSPPRRQDEWALQIQGEPLRVIVPQPNAALEQFINVHALGKSDAERVDLQMEWLIIGEHPYEIIFDPELQWIQARGVTYRVNVRDLAVATTRPHSGDGRIKAPIPGQITQIFVEPGQRVEAGAPLMILEAMKMENRILAPMRGVVNTLHVNAGERVMLNQVLVELETVSD
ncbi:MAG: hypothetical protein B6D41_10450 [Chloroflexi bacterium UTCFX4]|jgi:biotin carboxyl carrier protein|nr:MAG: hypothetical protein B6D41_10450 [Chloroflexi bacterium UTCFX4]